MSICSHQFNINKLLIWGLFFISCFAIGCKENKPVNYADQSKVINSIIDQWHLAASNANFENYFKCMSSQAVFIGTDPTENWGLDSFKSFCKPYFDKGKAWSFTSFKRNIYFNQDSSIAWFDELLNTHMKICRGSGVLIQENHEWKIAHYVLSMTIPNDKTKEVVALKSNRRQFNG